MPREHPGPVMRDESDEVSLVSHARAREGRAWIRSASAMLRTDCARPLRALPCVATLRAVKICALTSVSDPSALPGAMTTVVLGDDGRVVEAFAGRGRSTSWEDAERQVRRTLRAARHTGDAQVAQWKRAKRAAARSRPAAPWRTAVRAPGRTPRRARRARRVARVARAGPDDGPPPPPRPCGSKPPLWRAQ